MLASARKASGRGANLVARVTRVARIARIALATLATLAACTPGLAAAQIQAPSPATQVPALSPITILAPAQADWLAPALDEARAQRARTAGNVSVIDESAWQDRAESSWSDVLRREAGVFAPSAAGQQSGKLSIRGSGLASPLGVRGLTLLRDGLPLNQADGTVDPAYLDPFNAQYIEVYRGANALEYGSATLGGAINVVSPTGESHPGVQARVEAGSFGYLRAQARGGRVLGEGLDAFVSASTTRTDGSADNAAQTIRRVYGNLGVRWGERSQGRFHMDVADMNQEVTSPLTRRQVLGEADTRHPSARWPDHHVRTRPHLRFAYQHTVDFGEGDRITAGASYTGTRFDLLGTVVPIAYRANDVAFSLRGEHLRTVADHGNRLVWGLQLAQGRSRSRTFGPFLLPGGQILDPSTGQYEAIATTAQTTRAYVENNFSITPDVTLITAAQATTARRTRDIDALRNPRGLPTYFKDVDEARRYRGIDPKLGLLWQATSRTQVYGNVSRSSEPPTTLEFYNAEGTTSAQRARTLEVGARGTSPALQWQAALFHSRIRDALLTVPKVDAAGRIVGTQGGNAPRTMHAGLELQLSGRLRPAALSGAATGVGQFKWDVSYTFSRFRHVNDATYGNHRLPVIPVHQARAGLLYEHPSGVYGGPDVLLSSSVYADQANTLRAPGYAVVNATLGYAHPSGRYRLFLNARNLADRRYAASSEYLGQAGPDAAAFNPGLRRALYAGAQIAW